jgi:hypothetical protein
MSSRNLSQRLTRLEARLVAANTRACDLEVQFVNPAGGVVRTLVFELGKRRESGLPPPQARTQDEGDRQKAVPA